MLDWLDVSLSANVFDCKTQSKSIQRLGWKKYTIHYNTTYTTILPFAVPFAHTEREKKKGRTSYYICTLGTLLRYYIQGWNLPSS